MEIAHGFCQAALSFGAALGDLSGTLEVREVELLPCDGDRVDPIEIHRGRVAGRSDVDRRVVHERDTFDHSEAVRDTFAGEQATARER